MPQASDEQRAKWGTGMHPLRAEEHLEQNFELNRDWTWTKKNKDYEPTEEDKSAIQYLMDEWDFGGIRE